MDGLGEQAAAAFPTPGRNLSSRRPSPEETKLSAESLRAEAADTYGPIFPNIARDNDSIPFKTIHGVEFKVSPVTTMLEEEAGRDLDRAIAAAAGKSTTQQQGTNFSPPPEKEFTELRSERLSAKEAGGYRMFSNEEDRNAAMTNYMKAAAVTGRVDYDANPFTTAIEEEVGKDLRRMIADEGGAHEEHKHYNSALPVSGRGRGGATTTVDMGRMKEDEPTVAEVTSAVIKAAEEAGDAVFAAGPKLF
ncbi:unnamed protein product [Urochloa humidicola]